MNWLRLMLVFVPVAFVTEFFFPNPVVVFVACCLALIPLAGLLGEATEELAVHTGPQVGGLLNATLGNAAELIITIVALSAGQIDLVKASITGSILGNLLLILGLSLLLGGLKHGIQKFDHRTAGAAATMMTLAIVGLFMPTLFEVLRQTQAGTLDVMDPSVIDQPLVALSVGVAAILILMYVLSLVFFFTQGARTATSAHGTATPAPPAPAAPTATPAAATHAQPADPASAPRSAPGGHVAKWSVPTSLGVLGVSTLLIVFLSEFLVGAVEPIVEEFGVSELFLGIIVIPLVGNVAEHIVGVQVAMKNQMDLSLAISLGSSQQIALFVAPLLVFVGLLIGQPMDLYFTVFEVATLGVAVFLATLISLDGRSNWLEGAQLLAVYVIIGLAFFFF